MLFSHETFTLKHNVQHVNTIFAINFKLNYYSNINISGREEEGEGERVCEIKCLLNHKRPDQYIHIHSFRFNLLSFSKGISLSLSLALALPTYKHLYYRRRSTCADCMIFYYLHKLFVAVILGIFLMSVSEYYICFIIWLFVVICRKFFFASRISTTLVPCALQMNSIYKYTD